MVRTEKSQTIHDRVCRFLVNNPGYLSCYRKNQTGILADIIRLHTITKFFMVNFSFTTHGF